MTNTHITIGGHKVTTNKVGTLHNITTLEAGFSFGSGGALKWIVRNGICVISMQEVQSSTIGNNKLLIKDIPPNINMVEWGMCYDNRGALFIFPNATELRVNVTSLSNLNATIVYPVADDWVES